MGLNFASKSIQFTQVIVPDTLASSRKAQAVSFVSSSPLLKQLGCRARLNNWRNSGGNFLQRACCASRYLNGFCNEELPKQVEELALKTLDVVYIDDDYDYVYVHEDNDRARDMLGIRSEIIRLNIEHKAKCLGIPLSLTIIKRKQKWKQGLGDAGDFACCSVKKAFSSLVFIIRELQSYVLLAREDICSEDLKETIKRVQSEMHASLVWLFQQIFSRTPTLMVYVMILLANFTVHLMSNSAVVAATPSPRLSYMETVSSPSPNHDQVVNHHELTTEEEVDLWNWMLEEASRMQDEWGHRHRILDHETIQQFVTSVNVELERDDYEDYLKTDLLYQRSLAEEPNNPLLLSNYARFLHLVARHYDRAEELFNRAIQVEASDAEALSGYADFLWIVRKDLCGAEERYQQAMAADPNNPSHASRYADFLWTVGGEDTCLTITTSHANDNKEDVTT